MLAEGCAGDDELAGRFWCLVEMDDLLGCDWCGNGWGHGRWKWLSVRGRNDLRDVWDLDAGVVSPALSGHSSVLFGDTEILSAGWAGEFYHGTGLDVFRAIHWAVMVSPCV